MSWFYFSLLSIAASATAELLQQHLLNGRKAFSERASAAFTFLFEAIIAAPFVLLSSLRHEVFSIFQTPIFFRVIVVSFISAIAAIFYFKSFKVKNISFSTIFISGSAIVSTILGIIFFSESVRIEKFIGILLILGAIILANYKNASLEKNHLFGLVAGACFGVAYTLDKSIVTHINPLIYIMWAFFFISIWIFLFSPKEIVRSWKGTSFVLFLPMIFSAGAYILYNIFTFLAYRVGGEVGKVDAINNSQIFLIILFEFFIMGHKQSIGRKVAAAVIAFSGVLLLGLAR